MVNLPDTVMRWLHCSEVGMCLLDDGSSSLQT